MISVNASYNVEESTYAHNGVSIFADASSHYLLSSKTSGVSFVRTDTLSTVSSLRVCVLHECYAKPYTLANSQFRRRRPGEIGLCFSSSWAGEESCFWVNGLEVDLLACVLFDKIFRKSVNGCIKVYGCIRSRCGMWILFDKLVGTVSSIS